MAVREFLRWWVEQLAGWIPANLRHRLQGRHTSLRLYRDPQGFSIHLDHKGRSHELGRHPGLDADELQGRLADHPPIERIDLILPPGRYLHRTVDLPLAAADGLTQAVGYQIESLTPFRRNQVWLFCGEQQRLPDGKRLRAWLTAVPRSSAEVLEALGLDVQPEPVRGSHRAPAGDDAIQLTFRPNGQARAWLSRGWALAGANLVALAMATGLHLDNRQAELDTLKQQSRSLQQQAIAASDLAHKVEQSRQRLDLLFRQRASQPTSVAVLDEVSQRLDSQTWLQRFELRHGKLRLQGISGHASGLIAELERSPLLGDVRFDASLTRNPNGGGERFNLTGQVQAATLKTDGEARP